MAQEVLQQIAQRLQESEHVLIAFPYAGGGKESGDALGSALALYGYLQKLGKKADLAAAGYETPERLKFLPHATLVQPTLSKPQNYTLRVNLRGAPLKQVSHGLRDGYLEIHLTPEHGTVKSEDVELHAGRYPYDTIVTLDAPDLPALGKLFEDHAELFYGTPIINIDHHSSNEQYGQINLVDINAAATGEIIAPMLKSLGAHHLDEHMATNLFAAMFLKTQGFKSPATTSNTLKVAAELIQLGARREEIMRQIYRSRSLASLRLWGKALAHLKHDPVRGLAWSTLTQREILESGGEVRELPEVIEELIFTAPEAQTMALLYEETENRICVMLANKKTMAVAPHALPWEMLESTPGLTKFCLTNHNLLSAEREVLEKLQDLLKLIPQS